MKTCIKYILSIAFLSSAICFANILPDDILKFVEKREMCDYYRGEFSGVRSLDEARDLNKKIKKHCKDSDKELLRLKTKHKNDESIFKMLDKYELIECKNGCDDSMDNTPKKPVFSEYSIEIDNLQPSESIFAGHYIITTRGCGANTICAEIVDIDTNETIVPLPNAYYGEIGNGNDVFIVDFVFDSTMLIVSGVAADSEIDQSNNTLQDGVYRVRYYNFKDNKLELIGYDEP